MRYVELIEGRDAPLYHAAFTPSAVSIITDRVIKPTTESTGRHSYPYSWGENDAARGRSARVGHEGKIGISLTRSADFAAYFVDEYRGGGFIFVLDQSRIAARYKILPTADKQLGPGARHDKNFPSEEWVIAPAGLRIDGGILLSIYPSPKFIKSGQQIPAIIANHPAFNS